MWDFIFVRDVAEPLLRPVEAPAPVAIVNVGTGGGRSVAEIVALIGMARATDLTAVGVPERCRLVERPVLRPETTRLVSLTRWRPGRELVEGLRETYEVDASA